MNDVRARGTARLQITTYKIGGRGWTYRLEIFLTIVLPLLSVVF